MKKIAVLCFVLVLLGCGKINYTIPDQGPAWPEHLVRQHDGNKKVAALIVSIESYSFLPPVVGADITADDWERFFVTGFGTQPTILKNEGATRERILEAVKQLVETSETRVWVVFVGHGAPDVERNQGLLVGFDAQQTPESLKTRSVTRDEIVESFAPETELVMVIDSCFSGRDSTGNGLAKGIQPVVPIKLKPPRAKVTVLAAAESTQYAGALPGTQRPAFSWVLLNGLTSGRADEDSDEVVTSKEAINYSRSLFRNLKGRTQSPTQEGEDVELFRAKQVLEFQFRDYGKMMQNGAVHESESGVFRLQTNEGFSIVTIKDWELPEYTYPGREFYTWEGSRTIFVQKLKKNCQALEDALTKCSPKRFPVNHWHVLPTNRTLGSHKGVYGTFWGAGRLVEDKPTMQQFESFAFQHNGETWRVVMERNHRRLFSDEEKAQFEKFVADLEFE